VLKVPVGVMATPITRFPAFFWSSSSYDLPLPVETLNTCCTLPPRTTKAICLPLSTSK